MLLKLARRPWQTFLLENCRFFRCLSKTISFRPNYWFWKWSAHKGYNSDPTFVFCPLARRPLFGRPTCPGSIFSSTDRFRPASKRGGGIISSISTATSSKLLKLNSIISSSRGLDFEDTESVFERNRPTVSSWHTVSFSKIGVGGGRCLMEIERIYFVKFPGFRWLFKDFPDFCASHF